MLWFNWFLSFVVIRIVPGSKKLISLFSKTSYWPESLMVVTFRFSWRSVGFNPAGYYGVSFSISFFSSLSFAILICCTLPFIAPLLTPPLAFAVCGLATALIWVPVASSPDGPLTVLFFGRNFRAPRFLIFFSGRWCAWWGETDCTLFWLSFSFD